MTIEQAMFQTEEDSTWDRVLFVDPGIMGTGCAYWEKIIRSKKKKMADAPKVSFRLNPKDRKIPWQLRSDAICAWFCGIVDHLSPKIIVIEFPELWSSSAASQASAGRGDLFKLTYLVGAFGEICRQVTNGRPVLISPAKWKGQLTKKAVHARIKRALGGTKYPEHIADAVGMGLAVQGKL